MIYFQILVLHHIIIYFTMEWNIGISDFDDKKVIDIAPESCDISKISIHPKACDCVRNHIKSLDLQDGTDDKASIKPDTCNILGYQPQNASNEVHEVYSDLDIEVDLAYRIIDTFKVCEDVTFKQESENISQNTETSLKIRHQNDHTQTPIKVEVDNQTFIETDLDYTINNTPIACSKKYIPLENDYVDYDTVNLKDDLTKNIAQQLQSKGMYCCFSAYLKLLYFCTCVLRPTNIHQVGQ